PYRPSDYDRPLPLPAENRFVCLTQESDDGAIAMWLVRDLANDGDYARLVRLAVKFDRDGAAAAFTTTNWLWSDSHQGQRMVGGPLALVVPEKATLDGEALDVKTRLKLKSLGLGTKLVLGELPGAAALVHSNLTADLPAPKYYPFFMADQLHSYFVYPVDATR